MLVILCFHESHFAQKGRMTLAHQEEVDLLKTVTVPASSPQPTLASPEMQWPHSVPEVTLDALETYIAHCFSSWHVLRTSGLFGCLIECV